MSRKASKSRKTRKQSTRNHVPAKQKEYAGAPIPTIKAYRRLMSQFRDTTAHCWLILGADTYTTLNTYKDGILPASYDAKHYTYPLTDKARKLIDKKIDAQGYEEVEPDEWPTFLTGAARKRAKYDVARNPGQTLDALVKGKAKVKAC